MGKLKFSLVLNNCLKNLLSLIVASKTSVLTLSNLIYRASTFCRRGPRSRLHPLQVSSSPPSTGCAVCRLISSFSSCLCATPLAAQTSLTLSGPHSTPLGTVLVAMVTQTNKEKMEVVNSVCTTSGSKEKKNFTSLLVRGQLYIQVGNKCTNIE